jgi:hypothetical protein
MVSHRRGDDRKCDGDNSRDAREHGEDREIEGDESEECELIMIKGCTLFLSLYETWTRLVWTWCERRLSTSP